MPLGKEILRPLLRKLEIPQTTLVQVLFRGQVRRGGKSRQRPLKGNKALTVCSAAHVYPKSSIFTLLREGLELVTQEPSHKNAMT